jgi:hypothetical protein
VNITLRFTGKEKNRKETNDIGEEEGSAEPGGLVRLVERRSDGTNESGRDGPEQGRRKGNEEEEEGGKRSVSSPLFAFKAESRTHMSRAPKATAQ